MKADYNSVIYAFESNNADILNIIADDFDAALEADANTPDEVNAEKAVSDTVRSDEEKAVNKTILINKIVERVKALIKKIGDIFQALKRKLSNRLRLLGETDKGFTKLYYKRKSMIKPYKSVQVISYAYVDQVLERPIEKIIQESLLCFDKLRAIEGTSNSNSRVSEIINAPQGKLVEVLLEPYVDSQSKGSVTTINDFIRYIVEKYRGDKKEIIYRDTQLPQIEANALSTKNLSIKCNNYLTSAQEAYNKLKTLEYQVSRNSTDEKVVKLVTANAAKAANLYNAFSALIHSYYELKLEQCLNYRIILKKFYQF